MLKLSAVFMVIMCATFFGLSASECLLAAGACGPLAQIDQTAIGIMNPLAQLGFAGAFVIASALVWWFAKTRREDWNTWHTEQLRSLEKTSAVIALNTEAHIKVVDGLTSLTTRLTELGIATAHLTEELIGRPCLLKEKNRVRYPDKE